MSTANIYLVLDPQSLGDKETNGKIKAPSEIRTELAKRLLVSEVTVYSFDYQVRPAHLAKDAWLVSGHVYGTVIQPCCVTSEPVTNSIDEHFQCFCADAATLQALEDRHLIAADDDTPEPFTEEGLIPIGELGIQHFALGIPLYPRLAGASWPDDQQ